MANALTRVRAQLQKWLLPRQTHNALTQVQLFELCKKLVEAQRQEFGIDIRGDMLEAEALSGAGPRMVASREAAKMVEAAGVQLKERLLELELALDNIGWRRQLAYADLEFSRNGLQGIIKIARLYYLKNPLIKRAVEISGSYVWARGFEVRCDDPAAQDTVDAFFEQNKSELGHVGMIEKEQTLRTDGNLFFLLFPSPTGGVTVRTVDAIEIQDIVTDPDDASIPWYYKRTWRSNVFNELNATYKPVQKIAWYPALDYDSPTKPTMIGLDAVMWDQPILHVKIGGLPKWLFGCPDVYSALDWAKKYREYLENWCTINASLARFLWDAKTKGGEQTIQALQQVLQTSVGSGEDGLRDFVDRNPPPTTGAAFIHGTGTELAPIKTGNVQANPEQGRRVGMMAGSALGLPETILFGDASTGSLATAQSLDRPTELAFLRRQEHWREILGGRIIPYVLRISAASPGGKLREAWGDDRSSHMVVKPVKRKLLKNGTLLDVWEAADQRRNGDVTISVKFPAILEHDIAIMVSAIVQAGTLGGFQPGGSIDMRRIAELLAAEVGIEDVEKMLDDMYPPGSYKPIDYANQPGTDDPADEKPQPGAHLVTPSFGREAQFLASMNGLREAVNKLKESR